MFGLRFDPYNGRFNPNAIDQAPKEYFDRRRQWDTTSIADSLNDLTLASCDPRSLWFGFPRDFGPAFLGIEGRTRISEIVNALVANGQVHRKGNLIITAVGTGDEIRRRYRNAAGNAHRRDVTARPAIEAIMEPVTDTTPGSVPGSAIEAKFDPKP